MKRAILLAAAACMFPAADVEAQQGWIIRKGLIGWRAKPFSVAVTTAGCGVNVSGGGCGNGYAAYSDLQRQVQELQMLHLKETIEGAIEDSMQRHVDDYHGSAQAQQAMMQMYLQQQMMMQQAQNARDQAVQYYQGTAPPAAADAPQPYTGVVYQRHRPQRVRVVPSYQRSVIYRR